MLDEGKLHLLGHATGISSLPHPEQKQLPLIETVEPVEGKFTAIVKGYYDQKSKENENNEKMLNGVSDIKQIQAQNVKLIEGVKSSFGEDAKAIEAKLKATYSGLTKQNISRGAVMDSPAVDDTGLPRQRGEVLSQVEMNEHQETEERELLDIEQELNRMRQRRQKGMKDERVQLHEFLEPENEIPPRLRGRGRGSRRGLLSSGRMIQKMQDNEHEISKRSDITGAQIELEETSESPNIIKNVQSECNEGLPKKHVDADALGLQGTGRVQINETFKGGRTKFSDEHLKTNPYAFKIVGTDKNQASADMETHKTVRSSHLKNQPLDPDSYADKQSVVKYRVDAEQEKFFQKLQYESTGNDVEVYMYEEGKGYSYPFGKKRNIPKDLDNVPKVEKIDKEMKVYRENDAVYDEDGEFLFRSPRR